MEASPAMQSAWMTLSENVAPATLEKLVRLTLAHLTASPAPRTGSLALTDAFRPSKEKEVVCLPLTRRAALGVLDTVTFLTASLVAATGPSASASAIGKNLRKLLAGVDCDVEPNQSLCQAVAGAFESVAEGTVVLSAPGTASMPLSFQYHESQRRSNDLESTSALVAVVPNAAFPGAPAGALRHEVMLQ